MTQNEKKKPYKFFQTPKVLKKLDPYEWVLFTVLFDEWQMMKNEEGWFFRSEKELSEDTGLSPATIYRKTKSLEEKGFILVKRHSDGKTKSEKYKSNDYKINIETVISLAQIESHHREIESHHREIESHQKDEPTNNIPSNNIITKENNKIYNINIKASEDITPDDGTLQDDEVENVFLNNSDDDWLNYEVKRSMMGEVNNDLKLNDMKKENEMSDNGTNAMNAISEQSERQAKENESSGCDKINEMTTSMATPNNINDTGTILQDTQVKNNESSSQPQVNNILPPPTLEEDTDPRITETIHNIDFSMNAMYKGRYDYGQFSSQYEYFTLQCHNLNVMMGDDKYQLYKKQYITPWWNKTKEYFPDGYEKLLKKPTQWEIDNFKKFYNWMEHAQEEREVASAYNNICALLEHLNSKYGEKTLDALTNQIIHEISAIKHRNNHVSNYIEKMQAS